jgi:hypothetical protein
MTRPTQTGRTYNQEHQPRPHAPGRRRISIYWTWSYPWESQRDVAVLDNRFSTMTEVRRVAWPGFEKPEYGNSRFLQGIAGTLELFHRSTLSFQRVAGTVTGHAVAVYQRVDQAGYFLPIDERILSDTDTLMVFGLDHLEAGEQAQAEEVQALRSWLRKPGNCLVLAPHHDVGNTDDAEQRKVEYRHHGDALVPPQQRFTGYGRSLLQALDIPVINQWGLCPALVPGTRDIAPLTVFTDQDEPGLMQGVPTLSFHQHLPHYALTREGGDPVRVLARQPVELGRPHPFTAAGNREINVVLWMPPAGERAADIVLVDSTHFTTLFGATQSLERFWRNLASMR